MQLSSGQTIEQGILQTIKYWINKQQPAELSELQPDDQVFVLLRALNPGEQFSLAGIFKEASASSTLKP